MEKTIINCKATTTFSSILGSLTSFSSAYFINKFPAGFFKKVWISESFNSINMDDSDVQKYNTPFVAFKPELSFDSQFTETLPYWYTSTRYIANGSRRLGYYPVLQDHENKIYIYAIPSRMKVNFNIKIKVPTAMFMYNTMHYIQSNFQIGDFEFVNDVRLQTEVPKILMINLAETLGFDMKTVEGREVFNNYLAEKSLNGITENINMSTGNNNYAFNFATNILTGFPEVVQGDKNIKNLIVDNGIISFMYSMELWIPNKFIIELPNNRQELTTEYNESDDGNKYKFNLVVNKDFILNMVGEKHLLMKKSFLPDVNVEYDELNFSSIINKEVKDVVNYMTDKKMNVENFFEVRIMCDNKYLEKGEYEIDYKNFMIKTKRPMYNTTYTLVIYGHLKELNSISEKLGE